MSIPLHRFAVLAITVAIGGNLVACSQGPKEPASLPGIVILSELGGMANDGDEGTRASPESHVYRDLTGTSATDGQTTANSDAATADQVGGSVHAIPGPHATQGAAANSNNRVEAELDVNDSGTYFLALALNLTGCKLSGGGTLGVFIRSNILDDSGLVVPGGEVSFVDMSIKGDGTSATIRGDEAHPIPLDAHGNVEHKFTGPPAGMPLKPGVYHVGMNLQIRASAPVGGRAEISKATLHLAMK